MVTHKDRVLVGTWLITYRMSRVCESWSLEDLTEMTEEDMEALLGYYKPGDVPSLKKIRNEPDFENFEFDGAFGWM